MKFNVDYKVGDYFSGVLLETFKEARISRPRVRPVEMFAKDIRVEFPRALREDNPLGTKFRALVKVAQKTNKKTGKIIGDPYLVATDKTIQLIKDYSPIKQIYAIPISDRLYEYTSETPEILKNPLIRLRENAYKNSKIKVRTYTTTAKGRSTSTHVHSYAIQRSQGICESCDAPAPFETRNGTPYLEVHHLKPISQGGSDHPENVAAVCPNCHRRTEKSKDSDIFNNAIIKKILAKEKKLGK
jgi:5-methylcytosine-specific restriction endonuclease McrA